MKQDAFLNSLDDLHAWFTANSEGAEQRPYFTIWRGTEAKQDRLIYRNTEISDTEKAWESLEDMIERHSVGGGTFRVYVTSKPSFNVGMTTIVKIPGPFGYQDNIRGLQGVPGGMYGIYGDPRTMIEEEVTRRMEVYDLKREVEDMKAGRDANIGVLNRFLENLVERPELYQLVQHVGVKLFSGMAGTQQHAPQTVPPAVQGMPMTDAETEGFDYDRVEPALDRLRTVFPDTETTLEKLAAWAQQNPDMAKNMMQTLG